MAQASGATMVEEENLRRGSTEEEGSQECPRELAIVEVPSILGADGRQPLVVQPARGKSGHHQAAGRGEAAGVFGASRERQRVSQRTYRPERLRSLRVRVKRRGKSPPPGPQGSGHEKPPAVQDRTGGTAPGHRREPEAPG